MPDGTRSLDFVMERLAKIEQILGDLDLNERMNILAYGICGYVCEVAEPGHRTDVVKEIGKAMAKVMLPAMIPVHDALARRSETASEKVIN